jgi:hypothetical protein
MGREIFPFSMKLSTKVVSDILNYSSDISLKNHCKFVLESYLALEPTLTEEQLRESLRVYLMGLE